MPILLVLALLAGPLGLGTVSASGFGVDPVAVSELVFPGESVTIEKTVQTPEIPPNPVVVFLADTTGSMGPAIANVRTNAVTVMNTVLAAQSTATFAVAEYRDQGDAFVFRVNQAPTADTGAVQAAINGWAAGGGGDTPEAQLYALYRLATGDVTFPADSTPIIAWFGDSSGHDPSMGVTESDATTALVAAGIKVVAVGVDSGLGDGLDNTGQATRIASATGGIYLANAAPGDVAARILEGLQNLPITVVPVPVGCDPLGMSFDPGERTVTSGMSAMFTETISVAAGTAGGTYACSVEFQDKGTGQAIASQDVTIHVPGIDLQPASASNELMPGAQHAVVATVSAGAYGPVAGALVHISITSGPNAGKSGSGITGSDGRLTLTYPAEQGPSGLGTDTIEAILTNSDGSVVYGSDTATKTWVDTTPPETTCLETVNPHGRNVPPAGRKSPGQNEDGFYELLARDAVDPEPDVYVLDTGSGTVFGPFASGTKIKYTEDASAVPIQKSMGSSTGNAGAIAWHIIGNGDAAVYAVDFSGNASDPYMCYVPPPPK